MSFSETISPIIGRWALAWYFLSAVMTVIHRWAYTVGMLEDHHMPVAQLMLVLALIVMVLGSLSLAFGYHTGYGAVSLFAILILANLLLHDYWNFADASARAAEYDIFSRNIAIAGGLLILVGVGPGPFGLDNKSKKPRR